MPIDPNIILGIKQPQIQQHDPLDTYGKSLTLQNLLRQSEESDKASKRQDTLRSLLATNPDENALRSAGFLEESLKVGKDSRERAKLDAETGKANADAGKTALETQLKTIEHGSSILSTAKDQASWDMARRVMSLTFPKIASQLPEQFDPQFVQAKIAEGQTMAQRLVDQRAAQQNAETGRHNVATEGNAAGTLKVAQDRLALDREQPKDTYDAERGVLVNPRSGAARPVTMDGQPLGAKDKPLTESQGKASGLALRATRANQILNDLEDIGQTNRGVIKQGVGTVPLVGGALEMGVNMLPEFAGGPSSPQQKVEQARRDFVNAALRVESGASISEGEFKNAERQYFPMPGDSPEVIAQKRRNRQTEIESLNLQGGKKPVQSAVKTRQPDQHGIVWDN